MKICPTSGRFGENCLLKLVLVYPILTQWWIKKNWVYFPFKRSYVYIGSVNWMAAPSRANAISHYVLIRLHRLAVRDIEGGRILRAHRL